MISGAIRGSDLEESLDKSAVLLLLQKPLQFFLSIFLSRGGGFKNVVLRSFDALLCIPFHHLTGH